MDHVYTMHLQYSDESGVFVEIGVDGDPSKHQAIVDMIARGSLMASFAQRVVVYNSEGFDVCSYIK